MAVRREDIIGTNAGLLLIWPSSTNLSRISIEITFLWTKCTRNVNTMAVNSFCGLKILNSIYIYFTFYAGRPYDYHAKREVLFWHSLNVCISYIRAYIDKAIIMYRQVYNTRRTLVCNEIVTQSHTIKWHHINSKAYRSGWQCCIYNAMAPIKQCQCFGK